LSKFCPNSVLFLSHFCLDASNFCLTSVCLPPQSLIKSVLILSTFCPNKGPKSSKLVTRHFSFLHFAGADRRCGHSVVPIQGSGSAKEPRRYRAPKRLKVYSSYSGICSAGSRFSGLCCLHALWQGVLANPLFPVLDKLRAGISMFVLSGYKLATFFGFIKYERIRRLYF
jgi:hypothetical protein